MCGRFAMDKETNDLIEEFVLDGNDYRDWRISYSIAPTDEVPIVRERRDKDSGEVTRTVEPAIWDFRPAFVKESKRPNFNARIETLATSGLWKRAFAGSRCLVPMRGYYEWSERDGLKIPHFLHGAGGLLAAAGIAAVRKEGEEWVVSTAIVTREARDASGEVHDRMPVFLERDEWDGWLNPVVLDAGGMDEMLERIGASSERVARTITEYEVDRRVNNSRTADPEDAGLIAPVPD
ncbi:SOS response-associated peptidase [Pseudolysinimonas sp.]|uniref:SOS response-associated peptidase n=1 Tax=Pseudolysinimonas sp. TaxID=2680009 RepID=UPI003F81E975